MSYKIEKPECAPSWFVPGIKCNVWNNPNVWLAFSEGKTLRELIDNLESDHER